MFVSYLMIRMLNNITNNDDNDGRREYLFTRTRCKATAISAWSLCPLCWTLPQLLTTTPQKQFVALPSCRPRSIVQHVLVPSVFFFTFVFQDELNRPTWSFNGFFAWKGNRPELWRGFKYLPHPPKYWIRLRIKFKPHLVNAASAEVLKFFVLLKLWTIFCPLLPFFQLGYWNRLPILYLKN